MQLEVRLYEEGRGRSTNTSMTDDTGLALFPTTLTGSGTAGSSTATSC